MICIVGEIGLEVTGVYFDSEDEMNQPFHNGGIQYGIDLTLHCKDKTRFHICGKNDWGYIISDALQPLLNYAKQVFADIDEKISKCKGIPEVIVLGRNEFRAVDIIHRLRGFGDPIKVYRGIPVVQVKSDNKIELLGLAEELPFN